MKIEITELPSVGGFIIDEQLYVGVMMEGKPDFGDLTPIDEVPDKWVQRLNQTDRESVRKAIRAAGMCGEDIGDLESRYIPPKALQVRKIYDCMVDRGRPWGFTDTEPLQVLKDFFIKSLKANCTIAPEGAQWQLYDSQSVEENAEEMTELFEELMQVVFTAPLIELKDILWELSFSIKFELDY